MSVQVAAAVYSYKKGPRFLLKNDEGPTVVLAASTHRMNRGKNFQKERSVSTSSVLIQLTWIVNFKDKPGLAKFIPTS